MDSLYFAQAGLARDSECRAFSASSSSSSTGDATFYTANQDLSVCDTAVTLDGEIGQTYKSYPKHGATAIQHSNHLPDAGSVAGDTLDSQTNCWYSDRVAVGLFPYDQRSALALGRFCCACRSLLSFCQTDGPLAESMEEFVSWVTVQFLKVKEEMKF